MPTFHEGVNHGHKPSLRWAEVQKNPNSPGAPFMLVLCAAAAGFIPARRAASIEPMQALRTE